MLIGDAKKFFAQNETPNFVWQPLNSGDTFTFECGRCGRCCRNRFGQDSIILSPYDIARLRTRLGISSGEFLRNYADLHLGKDSRFPLARIRFEEDRPGKNRCPFLRSYGCRVYDDRPLRCRLFPLGRCVDEGISYFCVVRRDPRCGRGEKVRTLEEWLKEVEAEPFCDWVDRYYGLLGSMDKVAYRRIDERLKFSLGVVLHSFDEVIPELVGAKPETDHEMLSLVLDALSSFIEEVVDPMRAPASSASALDAEALADARVDAGLLVGEGSRERRSR